MINYFLDTTTKTIRGGMINFLITMVYLILGVWSIFDLQVREGVLSMADFLKWFFISSFGIWQVKNIAEVMVSGKTTTTTTTDTSVGTPVVPSS